MWSHKHYLSKDDLQKLSSVIGEAEKSTSGEIRVVVRHKRRWNEKSLTLHDLALKEFHHLGMQNTRDRTGILILILFSEHAFQIIADQGIHTKVEGGTWDAIAAGITSHFKDGNYVKGITDAVIAVGTILAKYFPRKADDANELSNEIIEQ